MSAYGCSIVRIGKTHDLAQCSECNWQFDALYEEGTASNKCRTHVKKTGHQVLRETASSTHYNPMFGQEEKT